MEEELLEDLSQALDGIDPMELLLDDGELFSIADSFMSQEKPQKNGKVGKVNSDSLDGNWDQQKEDFEFVSLSEGSPSSCDETAVSSPLAKLSHTGPKRHHKCKVCAKPAKGHKYFGVVACLGCRSFFSRAIRNKTYLSFVCESVSSKDECKILECQQCRYVQCLQQGMRPPGQASKEKEEMDEKTLLERRNAAAEYPTTTLMIKAKILLQLSPEMTPEEKQHIEHFATMCFRKSYKNFIALIGQNMEILKGTMELVYQGKTVPLRIQKQMRDYLSFVASTEYLGLMHASNLSLKDKVRLAQGNFLSSMEFNDAYRLYKHDNLKNEMEALYNSLKSYPDEGFSRTVIALHSEVTLNGKLDPVRATYEHTYGPECLASLTEDEALRHRAAVKKLADLGAGTSSSGVYDPIILVLTLYIILYSNYSIDLDDSDEAERMQLIYITMLQRYLQGKNEPASNQVFRNCILAISYARELRDVKMNAFKRLK